MKPCNVKRLKMNGKDIYRYICWFDWICLIGLLAAVLAAFCFSVSAAQATGDAATEIVTTIGVIGLVCGICAAYAAALKDEQRVIMLQTCDFFLFSIASFVIGLVIMFGGETALASPIVISDYQLTALIKEVSHTVIPMLFFVGAVLTLGAAYLLFSLIAKIGQLRTGVATPPFPKFAVIAAFVFFLMLTFEVIKGAIAYRATVHRVDGDNPFSKPVEFHLKP